MAAVEFLPGRSNSSRVLITGACRGVGRACAEVLAQAGAELILTDVDEEALADVAGKLGATSFRCDVASEASVQSFSKWVLNRFPALDLVINAAGGGYERTLGMYRVSRAFIPALEAGGPGHLVNVPPSGVGSDVPPFPYASSRQAFQRLSSALANEVRDTAITVIIACPSERRLAQVLADPNAGAWARNCDLRRWNSEDAMTLAWQLVSLLKQDAESRRLAG